MKERRHCLGQHLLLSKGGRREIISGCESATIILKVKVLLRWMEWSSVPEYKDTHSNERTMIGIIANFTKKGLGWVEAVLLISLASKL